MQKQFKWQEPGRESIELTIDIDGHQIQRVEMRLKGCLEFLTLSQKMKAKLKGPVANLLPPTGTDHSSMIWREMICQIQGEWQLPVTQEELCHCRKITTQKVDRSIVYGAHTIEEVRKRTSANTGCGTCKHDVAEMINYRMKV